MPITNKKASRPVTAAGPLLAVFAALLLTACQPEVDMRAVDAAAQASIRRTDQFQALLLAGGQLHAVGSDGVHLTSADQGLSWQRHELPGKPPLIDITVCPDGSLAALDFYRRVWVAAAGEPLTEPHAIDADGISMAIACDPTGHLWVVGEYAQILTSVDGGATWQARGAGEEDLIFTTVDFTDERTGYVTGEFGTVMATEDGGATWQRRGEVTPEFYPQAALLLDADTLYLVSLSGQIYVSRDGASTWLREPTPTRAVLYNIARVGDRLLAVGNRGTVLLRGTSGWKPFRPKEPAYAYLRGLAPLGPERFVVVGGNGTLRTWQVPESVGFPPAGHP